MSVSIEIRSDTNAPECRFGVCPHATQIAEESAKTLSNKVRGHQGVKNENVVIFCQELGTSRLALSGVFSCDLDSPRGISTPRGDFASYKIIKVEECPAKTKR